MSFSRSVESLILVSFVLLAAARPIKSGDMNESLTQIDLQRETIDRARGPALSSAVDDVDRWQSFNQWMCFDADQVKIEEIKIKLGTRWKPWPEFVVTTPGQQFRISLDVDREVDATPTKTEWERLLRESKSICFYAAFLQYLEVSIRSGIESLWILEDIKFDGSYWNKQLTETY